MKKFIVILLLCLPVIVSAQNMAGGYDFQVYYTPEGKPYVEAYFWISGRSLTYRDSGNVKKAQVEVMFIISQGDKVTSYDKYLIESQDYALKDTLYGDVLDMRHYFLPDGPTTIEFFVKDNFAKGDRSIERRDTIKVENLAPQTVSLSHIQFVEMYQKTNVSNGFTKAGYDIVPYVGALYEESVKKLVFYAEIYNTATAFGSTGKYLLSYYLENNESGRQMEDFTVRKREMSTDIKPVLATLNIENLAGGNYNLVIEVRDSTNKLVTVERRLFRRENSVYTMREDDFANLNTDNTFISSIQNRDSLIEYIHSLKPIAGEIEMQYGKNAIKNGDITLMKRFLLSFWSKRDGLNPGQAFSDYEKLVAAVEERFGTRIRKGYNTARGRVYLQYGPPAVMTQRYNETNTYPYEIWQYYQLKGQTNVRFVFYNTDLVSNDFQLLHSDLRGEINNKQWEMFLHNRNSVFNVDDEKFQGDQWSRDLYNQPR